MKTKQKTYMFTLFTIVMLTYILCTIFLFKDVHWVSHFVNIISVIVVLVAIGMVFYKQNPDNTLDEILSSKKWRMVTFLAVLFVGIVARTILLGSIPNGLNPDEASMLYEAYCIGKFGIDRNGHQLPVYLEAWGGGQNALLTYLTIPFVLMFGMNVFSARIVSLLFSIADIIVLYLLVKRLHGAKSALLASFLFSICPWGVMMGRWGLESNLFPSLLLFAFYFLVRAVQDNHWYLLLACLFFGISLYSYALSFMFVPLFLVVCYVYLFVKKQIKWKSFVTANAILFSFALPLMLFMAVNIGVIKEFQLFGLFTIPELAGFRGGDVGLEGQSILKLIRVLFLQNDSLPWNSLLPFGFLFSISLPFFVCGLLQSIKELKQESKNVSHVLMMIWITCSLLLACITKAPNANKINMIWFPVIYFVAIGLNYVFNSVKHIYIPILACYGLLFVVFGSVYYNKDSKYNKNLSTLYDVGLIEATEFVEDLNQDNKQIFCSVTWESFIYTLVANKTSPKEFSETVQYNTDDSSFRKVVGYSNYNFGFENVQENQSAIFIVKQSDDFKPEGNFTTKTFGIFVVYY